jgi:predicted ABC-type ATPase
LQVKLLRKAEALGYTVVLVYFWLESMDLAKNRVFDRVKKGGHNIPTETIERRYKRGVRNFFELYRDVVYSWIVYDNSKELPYVIAKGGKGQKIFVYNHDIWDVIRNQNESSRS